MQWLAKGGFKVTREKYVHLGWGNPVPRALDRGARSRAGEELRDSDKVEIQPASLRQRSHTEGQIKSAENAQAGNVWARQLCGLERPTVMVRIPLPLPAFKTSRKSSPIYRDAPYVSRLSQQFGPCTTQAKPLRQSRESYPGSYLLEQTTDIPVSLRPTSR